MFPASWHRYLFLFGLIGLGAGMLFGAFPTSVPQIVLAANWVLEKNFRNKWLQLKSNRVFWVIASLFLLHIIGITYTQNINRGFDDLLNKLPLIAIPVILFSSSPLSSKELKLLLNTFFLSVLVSSVYCYLVYCGYTYKTILDVRKASVFMSHIRFSLFIAFAIIGITYSLVNEKKILIKIIYALSVFWLFFIVYKLQMATGFVCLCISSSIILIYLATKNLKKSNTVIALLSFTLIMGYCVSKAKQDLTLFTENEKSVTNNLRKNTYSGRPYINDTVCTLAENGTLVGINVCDIELMQEWKKRSIMPYNYSKDKKGNDLRLTILRYLASKGLSKDSITLNTLTNEEIQDIENGTSNYLYPNKSGLTARWRELIFEYSEYKKGENPSGHTLAMRFEFWKTALYIINKYPVFGVGTGDVQDEFNKAYTETNSTLTPEWRLRCHNQYLAIGVAFGTIGVIVFSYYLMWPAIILRKKLHVLYWPFLLIALLSFITEDTLETQAGVAFFVFFQTLFLWLASYKESNTSEKSKK